VGRGGARVSRARGPNPKQGRFLGGKEKKRKNRERGTEMKYERIKSTLEVTEMWEERGGGKNILKNARKITA